MRNHLKSDIANICTFINHIHPNYAIKCGAEKKIAHVDMMIKAENKTKHKRSTTMAAKRQSFFASCTSSSRSIRWAMKRISAYTCCMVNNIACKPWSINCGFAVTFFRQFNKRASISIEYERFTRAGGSPSWPMGDNFDGLSVLYAMPSPPDESSDERTLRMRLSLSTAPGPLLLFVGKLLYWLKKPPLSDVGFVVFWKFEKALNKFRRVNWWPGRFIINSQGSQLSITLRIWKNDTKIDGSWASG